MNETADGLAEVAQSVAHPVLLDATREAEMIVVVRLHQNAEDAEAFLDPFHLTQNQEVDLFPAHLAHRLALAVVEDLPTLLLDHARLQEDVIPDHHLENIPVRRAEEIHHSVEDTLVLLRAEGTRDHLPPDAGTTLLLDAEMIHEAHPDAENRFALVHAARPKESLVVRLAHLEEGEVLHQSQ